MRYIKHYGFTETKRDRRDKADYSLKFNVRIKKTQLAEIHTVLAVLMRGFKTVESNSHLEALSSLSNSLVVWRMVSTLALINEVNLPRTRLVLRWVTVSGSIPGAGHLFQYVTN